MNATSQLVASLLATSHLPKLERPQDNGPLFKNKPELLRSRRVWVRKGSRLEL